MLLNPYRTKSELNVNVFNRNLQHIINPVKPGALVIDMPGMQLREGDKVMQTKNTTVAKNGDIGYIRSITRKPDDDDPSEWNYQAEIEFNGDGVLHPYTKDQLQNIDLAYSSTIHKSQGEEYKTVIMIVCHLHDFSLRRNLIYTGITRAKVNCALIGQKDALAAAISNNKTDMRYTLLAKRLRIGLSEAS